MSAGFKYDISVLLPTRGRTDALRKSIQSLYDNATDPASIQLMLGFDRDDTVGLSYFDTSLKPWLDSIQANYTALKFKPMGYIRLNEYVNAMAKQIKSRWYIIWNDDAVMKNLCRLHRTEAAGLIDVKELAARKNIEVQAAGAIELNQLVCGYPPRGLEVPESWPRQQTTVAEFLLSLEQYEVCTLPYKSQRRRWADVQFRHNAPGQLDVRRHSLSPSDSPISVIVGVVVFFKSAKTCKEVAIISNAL